MEEGILMSIYGSKTLNFLFVSLVSTLFPSTLLLSEPTEHDKALCGKLESVLHDPQIGMRLESRPDGFILRMQSKATESQSAARAFAVEVIKQHDLLIDVPQTNGYGLPEQ